MNKIKIAENGTKYCERCGSTNLIDCGNYCICDNCGWRMDK